MDTLSWCVFWYDHFQCLLFISVRFKILFALHLNNCFLKILLYVEDSEPVRNYPCSSVFIVECRTTASTKLNYFLQMYFEDIRWISLNLQNLTSTPLTQYSHQLISIKCPPDPVYPTDKNKNQRCFKMSWQMACFCQFSHTSHTSRDKGIQ